MQDNCPFKRKREGQASLKAPDLPGQARPPCAGKALKINEDKTADVVLTGGAVLKGVRLSSRIYAQENEAGAYGSFAPPPEGASVIVQWLDGQTPYIEGSLLPLYGLESLKQEQNRITAALPPDAALEYGPEGSLCLQAGDDLELSIDRKEKSARLGLFGQSIEMAPQGICLHSTAGAGLILQSVDSHLWQPNVLQADPFTGLPHGGPAAGIKALAGAGAPAAKTAKNKNKAQAAKSSGAGLEGAALGAAMKEAVDKAVAGGGEADREALFAALGTAIADYLKAHAQVIVQPGIAVQCDPASGAGITTGQGTGSVL